MTNPKIEFKKIRNTIIKGIVGAFLPVFIVGKNESFFESLPLLVQGSVYLVIIILFFYSYIICWMAAYQYAKYKGYPGYWGLIAGLLNVFGLSFLFLLDNKKSTNHTSSTNNSLEQFSISYIFISVIAINIFFFPFIVLAIALSSNIGIREILEYFDDENFVAIIGILLEVILALYFFKEIKRAKINLKHLIGSLQKINFKLPIGLAIAIYFFAWGFNSITLYSLSFIFPQYVENRINYEYFSNYIGFIAFTIGATIFAPIMEELFFRGIILQKVAVNIGIIRAILISAIIFALVHFRYDIVSLLITGIILAILYLKSKKLIIPIIYHFIYNLIVTVRLFYHHFLSNINHSIPMTIAEYQQQFLDNLGLIILFIALSAPYLIYFIYKNFPRNYNINKLPYFANQAD